MKRILWKTQIKSSPILATAIHNGHYIDENLLKYIKIDDNQRLREEDPFTADFIKYFENKLIVYRSRFQVDLNRSKEQSIYKKSENAWGLDIWKELPPKKLLEKSIFIYEMFYNRATCRLPKITHNLS